MKTKNTWASVNFLWHFTFKRTRRPLPLLRGFLSYTSRGVLNYRDAACKVGLWKKCVFAPKCFVYRGEINGSETLLKGPLSRYLATL